MNSNTQTESRQDQIERIADFYGYEAQSRQLIEEMAELIQAINKHWRTEKDSTDKTVYSILEEIADVRIMLSQLIMIFDCEKEVEDIINRKVERLRLRLEGKNHEQI